ncbi:hypothetical protein Q0Z83_106490 [Actinoplanes sichuanensis]|uniref:Transporter (Transmembrane protein) n=1 Tax=Actinoplanes sichuanensis TaxID=512349 RepID=A0ABW4ALJ9_9ACTN|nr:hypothetical protein [Actinoplanes sichuanensis]BEL12458.1 hypothetical protein Q0Z83_106490 [Actinoplanes sichuanensis]
MTGDGLTRSLNDMWRSVVLYLPTVLVSLLILVVGYLLARLARTLTAKALRRAGFDRVVQSGPAGRLLRPGTPSVTDVCARLVFFVVFLFALQAAFGVWGTNPASDLITALISWLPQVLVAIVIVVVTAAIARAAHDLVLAVLGGLAYARVLAKAAAAVIVTLGVIAGLDQIGIATSVTRPLLITILATVAGVIIVGVGGGLIRPMQQRWEGWLDRAAAESAVIRSQARAYAEERSRQAEESQAGGPSAESAPSGSAPSGSAPAGLGSDASGWSGSGSAGSAGSGSVGSGSAGDFRAGEPGGAGSRGKARPRPHGSGSGWSGDSSPDAEPVVPGRAAGEAGAGSAAGGPGGKGSPSVAEGHGGDEPSPAASGIGPATAVGAVSADSPVGFGGPGGTEVPPVVGGHHGAGVPPVVAGQDGYESPSALSGRDADESSSAGRGAGESSAVSGQGAGESSSAVGGRLAEDRRRAAEARLAGEGDLAAEVRRAAEERRAGSAGAVGAGVASGGLPGDGAPVAPDDDRQPGPGERSDSGWSSPDSEEAPTQVFVGGSPAGTGNRPAEPAEAAESAGSESRTAPFDHETASDRAAVAGAEYPEEAADWAWETRWAEEERRTREHDSDETQVIVAPVDDRPHMIPGFDRYDDPPTDPGRVDEDDTVYVRTGTAETTLLTPGVRPSRSPAPDPPPNAEPAAGHTDEPTTFLSPGGGTAGGPVTADEPTTFLSPGGEVPADSLEGDEPTTSLPLGGEPAGSRGGSEEVTTSVITRGADVGDEPTVVHEPGTDSAVVIDGDDEDRTRLVPLEDAGTGADQPTVPGAAGAGAEEPTVPGVGGSGGVGAEEPTVPGVGGSGGVGAEEPTVPGVGQGGAVGAGTDALSVGGSVAADDDPTVERPRPGSPRREERM